MDVTERFSSRVEDYIRHRPSYPQEVLTLLEHECGFTDDSVVADIGAGTGILTRLFLDNENAVFAVEPNEKMREAADRLLGRYGRYLSVSGRAEFTRLRSESVDFVTAGQAFHWFDREQARAEFLRILKPEGWVVLIWNDRRLTDAPFVAAYEAFLEKHGIDYADVKHRDGVARQVDEFFGPARHRTATLANHQRLDFEGLRGRLLSASYIPQEGHPGYEPMLRDLQRLFGDYQDGGAVTLEYDTRLYFGQLQS